jgi:hypothetical protein
MKKAILMVALPLIAAALALAALLTFFFYSH